MAQAAGTIDAEAELQCFAHTENAMLELIARRSGQSVHTIRNWCNSTTYMDALKAVENNMADAIVEAL